MGAPILLGPLPLQSGHPGHVKTHAARFYNRARRPLTSHTSLPLAPATSQIDSGDPLVDSGHPIDSKKHVVGPRIPTQSCPPTLVSTFRADISNICSNDAADLNISTIYSATPDTSSIASGDPRHLKNLVLRRIVFPTCFRSSFRSPF